MKPIFKHTRYMSLFNRHDVMEDALEWWAQHKYGVIASVLCQVSCCDLLALVISLHAYCKTMTWVMTTNCLAADVRTHAQACCGSAQGARRFA